jgi:outer membrane lipoprotein-sorting protein
MISVVMLLTAIGSAQDAQTILQQVSEKYSKLQSYQFDGKTLAESSVGGKSSVSETLFEVAFASPSSLKVEFRYTGGDYWTRLSDGKTLVRFRSTSKDLKREPSSANDVFILKSTFIGDLEKLSQTTSEAKLTGAESLSVDGKDIDCFVVEARQRRTVPDGTEVLPTKWWIDKTRMIVLKQVSGTRSKLGGNENRNMRTLLLTKAVVDETLPPQLFVFAAKQK